MIRLLVVLALLVPLHAQANPSLAEARKAVDEIRYDDARRLLVEALKRGANQPDELVEIYRLSGATAAVLGPTDLAEQYYRRMIALDPNASLPADASPRLREPFVAAQAYMAAQQRFDARVARTDKGITVDVTDPLRMVVAVATLDDGEVRGKVTFEQASVVVQDRGSEVVLLDEHSNFLRVLELPARASAAVDESSTSSTPVLKRPLTWAIPAAVFGAAAVALFVDGHLAKQRHDDILANDSMHFFGEADDERRRWQRDTIGGYIAAVLGVGFATTAIVLATRRSQPVTVTPSAGRDSASVVLEAKF